MYELIQVGLVCCKSVNLIIHLIVKYSLIEHDRTRVTLSDSCLNTDQLLGNRPHAAVFRDHLLDCN